MDLTTIFVLAGLYAAYRTGRWAERLEAQRARAESSAASLADTYDRATQQKGG